MKTLIFSLLIFFCSDCPAQTESVKAHIFLDSTNFLVGDKIYLHITVETDGKQELQLPPKPKINFDTAAFEIQNYTDWNANNNIYNLNIVLFAWDSGEYKLSLAPFNITVSDNKLSETIFPKDTLTIKILNPKDLESMTAPQPIKDIIREDSRWEDYLPYALPALTAILIGFIFWRLWKYYKQKEKPVAAVAVNKTQHTPKVWALQQLANLKKKEYPQTGSIKQYYIELSEIVRTYIENEYKIPALEKTTNELIKALNRKSILPANTKTLGSVLNVADLAKFAQVTPSTAECEQHGESIKAFVTGA